MTDEARIEQTPHGKMAASDGWFVLHASEARWVASERFGAGCVFEGEPRFEQLGVHLRVLEPGKPACLYHSESTQEAFYVISGECTLVVEEQERSLRAGHFFHCPPGTRHVLVGAGDEPCVVLMMGARSEDQVLDYPVSEVAARHGASARARTGNPEEAYGDRDIRPTTSIWPLYGAE
jgi:uncharacterized cupin superfamily protein